jgi:hypothetical protein
MKPNLLIVQPHAAESDPTIDQFCETLCETHYVYLIRPLPKTLDDSPAGVRFLNFSLDHLPGFGEVEKVIIVDSPEITNRVKEKYPSARLDTWDRKSKQPSAESAKILQGDFGQAAEPLAKAI